MKRRHLFEFNEQKWLPSFMNSWITAILRISHMYMENGKVWAPKVSELLKKSGKNKIVDLCSGSGGPLFDLLKILAAKHDLHPEVTMTDLIPNMITANEVNSQHSGIHYLTSSVNAKEVSKDIEGVRTIFLGFHHMKPEDAFQILENAFHNREYIFISETTQRSPLALIIYGLAPIHFFKLTLEIKPTRLQLFFTFVIPILPLMLGWDNVISCLRTYSASELREMTAKLKSDHYKWEIGALYNPKIPTPYPYLMGYPVNEPPHS
jgi:hypothetical protein